MSTQETLRFSFFPSTPCTLVRPFSDSSTPSPLRRRKVFGARASIVRVRSVLRDCFIRQKDKEFWPHPSFEQSFEQRSFFSPAYLNCTNPRGKRTALYTCESISSRRIALRRSEYRDWSLVACCVYRVFTCQCLDKINILRMIAFYLRFLVVI